MLLSATATTTGAQLLRCFVVVYPVLVESKIHLHSDFIFLSRDLVSIGTIFIDAGTFFIEQWLQRERYNNLPLSTSSYKFFSNRIFPNTYGLQKSMLDTCHLRYREMGYLFRSHFLVWKRPSFRFWYSKGTDNGFLLILPLLILCAYISFVYIK